MRIGPILTALGIACSAAGLVHAMAPSFTVRCMHTSGAKVLDKYGTYYFFLHDGQVKGFGCSVPGRPCKIVSRDANTIVFQTPGDFPDTITMDLRDGSLKHVTAAGEEATFACRQIPNDG